MLNIYNDLIFSQVHGPSIYRKTKKRKVIKKNKYACSAIGVVNNQGGIWFVVDFCPKTQGDPIFLADYSFMKIDEIAEKLMGSEGCNALLG